MRIKGVIRPAGGEIGFTRESWCELIHRRYEFHRYQPKEVMQDGRAVGQVYWSMSEEPLVNVSVEPSALPWVLEWAKVLGGEFRQDSSDPESSTCL